MELLLLEHAKELGLRGPGHLADLVQEDGPSVCKLEETPPGVDSAGEGALLVPEELTFQQRLGQGGHVDGDEGPVPSGREVMNASGDELLPRA